MYSCKCISAIGISPAGEVELPPGFFVAKRLSSKHWFNCIYHPAVSHSGRATTDEVRRYVASNIPSVPYLEALLLMRSEPTRVWDVPFVAARLYVTESRARALFAELVQARVADSAPGGFVYAPATQELKHLLDDLAHAYSRDLAGISSLIHSRLERRARQFADAFRLKRDE